MMEGHQKTSFLILSFVTPHLSRKTPAMKSKRLGVMLKRSDRKLQQIGAERRQNFFGDGDQRSRLQFSLSLALVCFGLTLHSLYHRSFEG